MTVNLVRWWEALRSNLRWRHTHNVMLRDELKRLVEEGGTTGHHSACGDTLSFYIVGLEEAGVPYELRAFPGRGYMLRSFPGQEFPWAFRSGCTDDDR